MTATEKVLDETQSNLYLYNLRANYEEETNSAASLRKELESANAELAQVQESTKQASLRDIAGQQGRDDVASAAVDAAAKRQIQTLQSRADALAAQLEAANERALSSERKLEEYEKRKESKMLPRVANSRSWRTMIKVSHAMLVNREYMRYQGG